MAVYQCAVQEPAENRVLLTYLIVFAEVKKGSVVAENLAGEGMYNDSCFDACLVNWVICMYENTFYLHLWCHIYRPNAIHVAKFYSETIERTSPW